MRQTSIVFDARIGLHGYQMLCLFRLCNYDCDVTAELVLCPFCATVTAIPLIQSNFMIIEKNLEELI